MAPGIHRHEECHSIGNPWSMLQVLLFWGAGDNPRISYLSTTRPHFQSPNFWGRSNDGIKAGQREMSLVSSQKQLYSGPLLEVLGRQYAVWDSNHCYNLSLALLALLPAALRLLLYALYHSSGKAAPLLNHNYLLFPCICPCSALYLNTEQGSEIHPSFRSYFSEHYPFLPEVRVLSSVYFMIPLTFSSPTVEQGLPP